MTPTAHTDGGDDRDDMIRAKVVRGLHTSGHYGPDDVPIDAAASIVATHNRGRAKELIDEMARDDASPVQFKVVGHTVSLEDDVGKVAAFIRRFGGSDAVPWDLQDEL